MLCVDARSLACPLPIVKLAQALRTVGSGEVVELLASDPGVDADLPAFCESTGHVLLSLKVEGAERIAQVQKV